MSAWPVYVTTRSVAWLPMMRREQREIGACEPGRILPRGNIIQELVPYDVIHEVKLRAVQYIEVRAFKVIAGKSVAKQSYAGI